jgi:ABC-type transport system involved in multi-copper enzyme maturation permease subunit
MFSRLLSIAANTFTETIRQPIYGALLIVTVLMMIANVALAGFTLEDDDKLLRDLGLSTLLLSGLFLSAFSATGVLTREIENKTVLTVVSKPVARPVFILGKYLGLMAALFLAYYIGFLAFAMSLRHKVLQNSSDPWDQPILIFGFGGAIASLLLAALLNYVNDAEFMGTALAIVTPVLTIGLVVAAFFDANWNVQPFSKGFISGQSVLAAFLVMMSVMIIAAVALAASTRLGQVMTLVVCTLVLMLGLVSDSVLGDHQETSRIASAAYRLYPNLGIFWVLDALNSNLPIPSEYVVRVCLYAVLQVAAILMIGVALFQKREVG